MSRVCELLVICKSQLARVCRAIVWCSVVVRTRCWLELRAIKKSSAADPCASIWNLHCHVRYQRSRDFDGQELGAGRSRNNPLKKWACTCACEIKRGKRGAFCGRRKRIASGCVRVRASGQHVAKWTWVDVGSAVTGYMGLRADGIGGDGTKVVFRDGNSLRA